MAGDGGIHIRVTVSGSPGVQAGAWVLAAVFGSADQDETGHSLNSAFCPFMAAGSSVAGRTGCDPLAALKEPPMERLTERSMERLQRVSNYPYKSPGEA